MLGSFLDGLVIVKVGDITLEATDAIVNAADPSLLGGGGVDGAIHARGGPAILAECELIRKTEYPEGLPTGHAVITTGGRLSARHVIHTVGPIYGQDAGREARLLADCYRNSLNLAVEGGITSIAFPSISTGVFSYPKHEAARIASTAIKDFANGNKGITAIHLVFFSDDNAALFLENHCF